MRMIWKKYSLNLEHILRHGEHSDIDGLDLFTELQVLEEILGIENNYPIDILNNINKS